MIPRGFPNWTARLLALAIVCLAAGASAQPQRVNLAKYQNCSASSAAAGDPAVYGTDGIVGNGNRWKSDPAVAGPHWLIVTLPLAMQVGSAHLYLGRDDIEPVAGFSLQYRSGGSWLNVPGATFSRQTATVFNVVFTSPVTASEFRFLSWLDRQSDGHELHSRILDRQRVGGDSRWRRHQ